MDMTVLLQELSLPLSHDSVIQVLWVWCEDAISQGSTALLCNRGAMGGRWA